MRRRLAPALLLFACSLAAPAAGAGRRPSVASPLRQGSVRLYARAYEAECSKTDGYGRSAIDFRTGKRSDATYGEDESYDYDVIFGNTSLDFDSNYFLVEIAQDDASWIRDLGELQWSEVGGVPDLPASDHLRGIRLGHDEGLIERDSEGDLAKARAGHVYALRVKDPRSDFVVVFRVDALEPNVRCDLSWRVVSDSSTPPDR